MSGGKAVRGASNIRVQGLEAGLKRVAHPGGERPRTDEPPRLGAHRPGLAAEAQPAPGPGDRREPDAYLRAPRGGTGRRALPLPPRPRREARRVARSPDASSRGLRELLAEDGSRASWHIAVPVSGLSQPAEGRRR